MLSGHTASSRLFLRFGDVGAPMDVRGMERLRLRVIPLLAPCAAVWRAQASKPSSSNLVSFDFSLRRQRFCAASASSLGQPPGYRRSGRGGPDPLVRFWCFFCFSLGERGRRRPSFGGCLSRAAPLRRRETRGPLSPGRPPLLDAAPVRRRMTRGQASPGRVPRLVTPRPSAVLR